MFGQVYMAGEAVTEIFGVTATGKNNFLRPPQAGVAKVSFVFKLTSGDGSPGLLARRWMFFIPIPV